MKRHQDSLGCRPLEWVREWGGCISIGLLAARLRLNSFLSAEQSGRGRVIKCDHLEYTMSSVSLPRRKVTEVLISCQLRKSNIQPVQVNI